MAPERIAKVKQMSPPSEARQDPRPAITRRLVLQSTLRLIAEEGFEGTTIELIAERSGVSRSTIYRHWPDPTLLYLEAFDPQSDDATPPVPSGSFTSDLHAYIQHIADRLNSDLFAAALAAQVDKARRDPAYRQAHLRYALTRNEYGMALFRSGIESGEVREDVDPELETDRILSFLVFQRLMKYKLIDRDLIEAVYSESIARCAPKSPRTRRP
jgi:AcrR family transcriptional regulator